MSENMEKGIPSFGEGEEKDKSKEPVPITSEELIDIFESDEFKKRFRQAARYTKETNCESQFGIGRDDYNPRIRYFGDVIEGFPDSIRDFGIEKSSEVEKNSWADSSGKSGGAAIGVIDFHFHPKAEFHGEPICCSVEDLFYGDTDELQIIPKLKIIGRVDPKGNYELLFIRKQMKKELRELPETMTILDEEFQEVVYKKRSQEDVLRVLRENGYKAGIIIMSKDCKITEEDKEIIKKFA